LTAFARTSRRYDAVSGAELGSSMPRSCGGNFAGAPLAAAAATAQERDTAANVSAALTLRVVGGDTDPGDPSTG